jgi:hypothetical protein
LYTSVPAAGLATAAFRCRRSRPSAFCLSRPSGAEGPHRRIRKTLSPVNPRAWAQSLCSRERCTIPFDVPLRTSQ